MENPDTAPMTDQGSELSRRKLWHGIFSGLGCGILTLLVSFACLFTIVVVSAFVYLSANTAVLEGMNSDDVLRSEIFAFAIILGGSVIFALTTGILGGRAVYRQSSSPNATRRLVISSLAGFVIAILLFVLGFIGGLALESTFFFPIDYSFGESAFALFLFIPTLLGIMVALIGGLLGTMLVFRLLLDKGKKRP